MHEINGFTFNAIGDLVSKPSAPSKDVLESTLAELYKSKRYICASRVEHRLNVLIHQQQKRKESTQIERPAER